MLRPLLASTVLCLVLSASAHAEPTTRPAVELFNGKDLAGWKWVSKTADSKIEDVWTVVDGNLRCKGKPAGYIHTEKDYTSFILKVEWRHLKPGNGGVLIRLQEPHKVWPKSIECQGQYQNAGDIWNIDNYKMTLDPERTKGRRTIKAKPSNEKEAKPEGGEWNTYEIIMDGTNLTVKVNGEVQNQATDVEVLPGKIALQSEGSEYEFRRVTLIPLD